MNSTFEQVRGVIADVMSISPERVLQDTDIEAELGPDSLEMVEIVMGLETVFGLELGDDATEIGTVGGIVERIDKRLANREVVWH